MISCKMLTAGYGGQDTIKEINWKAQAGRLAVITGPNGSGKSTLLKTLMGQVKKKSGSVHLLGREVSEYSHRERAQLLAYLPQNRSDTNISVARMVLHGRFPYLDYPRHYTKEDEDKVEQALEKAGIAHVKQRPVSELSGGEKQKAYLAMALVQDTPVLLLDEPAAHLDMACRLELMELLLALSKEGKTVVAVLHDLNFALQYADEISLMEKGRLVCRGTPSEILETGNLEKVFRLRAGCLKDGDGKAHYYFSPIR